MSVVQNRVNIEAVHTVCFLLVEKTVKLKKGTNHTQPTGAGNYRRRCAAAQDGLKLAMMAQRRNRWQL